MSKEQRILTADELKLMRSVCNNALEHAIFEFLRSTGCRVNEMVHVERQDLDIEHNEVYLKVTKRKVKWEGADGAFKSEMKPRYSVLDEEAVGALRIYLKTKNFRPQSRLFPRTTRAVRDMVKRWAYEAQIQRPEEVHPHTFRHTRATDLLARGVPEAYIMEVLGWSKGSTTFRTTYQHAPREVIRAQILKAGRANE